MHSQNQYNISASFNNEKSYAALAEQELGFRDLQGVSD